MCGAHVLQTVIQLSLNLCFTSILGHLDTTEVAAWVKMTPTSHTLTPEGLCVLDYHTQPRMKRRSRSFRPACQCTVKDGQACCSRNGEDEHEGCAYARPLEQCVAPQLS